MVIGSWIVRGGAVASFALGAYFASAATVAISFTPMADIATAEAEMAVFLGEMDVFESFEGFAPGTTRDPVTTVGTFAGQGDVGTGSTAIDCGTGRGDGACVKPGGPAGGRFATDGDAWLDSNDMPEIVWTLGAGTGSPDAPLRRIAFLLSDIDDVGSTPFSIDVAGDAIGTFVNSGGLVPDAGLYLVRMDFSGPARDLTIRLGNGHNDGFGIDSVGIALASQPPAPPVPTPLPAAGWLMIAGIGGLIAMRRRRRA